MKKLRDYSITKKLTLMNMLVITTTLLLACGVLGAYELRAFRTNLVRSLSIQSQIIGDNSIAALLFNDTEAAAKTLTALRADPAVISSSVFTSSGAVLALYRRDRVVRVPSLVPLPAGQTETHLFTKDEITLVRSISFQGKPLGVVRIRSDLREMNDSIARYAGVVAAVLVVSLAVGLVILLLVQRAATRPILQLAGTAKVVSRDKNYSVRAPSPGNQDEVGLLIEAFNEMLGQIQQRDEALQASQEGLEARVAQRTAELDATNKELEAFTYSVAHDLRAPLRHIQGFGELLADSVGPQLGADARKYLSRINEGTQQMGNLIEDLLGLAHVSRQEPRIQVTGLNSVVKEVLLGLQGETGDRDIQWQIGDLPFVECDPGLVKQVFYNLLSNAVKYTRPRKTAVIDIGQMSVDGQLVTFVRDNGVGFNMKYSKKLFGVFQRLHRQEDFEGTGVGLATVQRIIHKHGGRIWAEAELDKGATFFFSLAAPSSGQPVRT